jgi:hypothetical protein
MDRATEGWPSRVHDWSYCCEPSSTRPTSPMRTMLVQRRLQFAYTAFTLNHGYAPRQNDVAGPAGRLPQTTR